MQSFLNSLGSVIWGVPMLAFFIFTSLRFSVNSRFFQVTGIKNSFKIFIHSVFGAKGQNGISQFSAFCSVLGACIGTGNIVGVATAVYSGGAGTVFWMVFSAFLSMMTAYAENYLGAEYTQKYSFIKQSVGSLSYIENGLKMKGLAKIYAFLCLMSVLGMGNMTQSNSISDALKVTFNASPFLTSLAVSFVAFIIIKGGIKRIAKFQTFLVPVAAVFYFAVSFAVLFKFKENIMPTLKLIFTEAFTLKALSGFGMYKAVRYGISRGVFSNEAGLGSSTLLHSQAKDLSGEIQGVSAMAEVFIDTVLMCGLTALTILVSTDVFSGDLFGAALSAKAYSTIGAVGKNGVGILIAVFAFTSLTSCSFYGEKSFQYLFGERYTNLYKAVYVVFALAGGIFSPKIVWEIADICNGLMAIPNLFALNCLSKEIHYPYKNL